MGFTAILLDISNGFGSVDLAALYPCLAACGIDQNSAALLSYVYAHGKGFSGNAVFDLLVGLFQGAPPSPLAYSLYQLVPLIASSPASFGGQAISVVDDTSVAFWGSTERESRGRARQWLEGAIPVMESFGLALNPLKCAVLSVGGVLGRSVFPSRTDWGLAPVKAGGTKLPLLTPAEWGGESGAIKTIKYLGRDLQVGRSDRLRADCLYEGRGVREGLGFSERLAALMRETRLETVGLPAIVAVRRVGERLGALFHGLYELHPPSPTDLATLGCAVRRAVRDVLPI